MFSVINETNTTYIYFFLFLKNGKLSYSQYLTLQPKEQAFLNNFNSFDKMYIIAKKYGIDYPTEYILMNIWDDFSYIKRATIMLYPDKSNIVKTGIVYNNQIIKVSNAYGNISQFMTKTTNISPNVIIINETNDNYIGIQVDMESLNKLIQYYSYTEVNINQNPYMPFLYFFVIAFLIILFVIVIIIFMAAIFTVRKMR